MTAAVAIGQSIQCVCGAPMVLRMVKKRFFWGCSRFPACKESRPSLSDGTPIGAPTDQSLMIARRRAHDAFEAWRKSHRLPRRFAYRVLQRSFDIPRASADIARFTIEQCDRLIKMCQQESPYSHP